MAVLVAGNGRRGKENPAPRTSSPT